MKNNRLLILGAAMGTAWVITAGRVFQIQVLDSGHYAGMAEDQSKRRVVIAPNRGMIFSKTGDILVANVDKREGVQVHFRWSRLCPNGTMAGQILGVVSRDGYGQSGLELQLDRDLRGTDGWRYVRLDARKRYTPAAGDRSLPPIDGQGVRLTMDVKMQEGVERALERGVARTGAKQGVAIVVEPSSGDILAMANYPFFDPNTREAEDRENWKNHAVSMVYEPGSIFKIITAAALLQEKRMAPADTVDAEGGTYKIVGHVIHDTHPLERVSFTDALALSSNIAFAKMSSELPQVDFYKYIRSFGFGMKTGVTLPAEESGRIQPVSAWSGRSAATLAFGHEISVTPLQMVMAIAAVANNGVLMQPRMVQAWVDGEGRTVKEESPRKVRRVISDSTASLLRSMMRGVVEYGTAAEIRHPSVTIAGKTGTAEKIDPETGKYMHGRFHSSFIGMAPAEQPAFVCLVMLDEPAKLKYGGQSAAPIFREILDKIVEGKIALSKNPEIWTAGKVWDSIPGTAMRRPATETNSPPLFTKASYTPVWTSQENPQKADAPQRNPVSGNKMPDLRKASLLNALKALQEFEVQVEYQGEGKVLEQEPPPGTIMHKGDHCRLKLGWTG